MFKVIINDCFGGFGFSKQFVSEWRARGGTEEYGPSRTCPIAIALLEEKGSKWSSDSCASLAIAEIPDDVLEENGGNGWSIDEYDGAETVVENYRSWGAKSMDD